MKRNFVQYADILLEPGADPAAKGEAGRRGGRRRAAGQVRTVFTVDAEDEAHVRTLIWQALAGGECMGRTGS